MSAPKTPAPQVSWSAHDVRAFTTDLVARLTGVSVASIALDRPLALYGLGSRDAVVLAGELEERFGIDLPATVAWERPTIDALVAHIVDRTSERPALLGSEAGSNSREPIAIVGIACRFPGAEGPDAFWDLLCRGDCVIQSVGNDHWARRGVPRDTLPKSASWWGGFLDDVDQFDPAAFHISPREAERMDPQQRILLELSVAALEDAGLPVEQLAGSRTGVFVGASTFDYARLQLSELTQIDAHTGTGAALSILANRISYGLDLRGPSVVIDTACSSSLVAVHLAMQSLWNGECDRALVAGVNVILSPAVTLNFAKAGAMAADGLCKFLDARADGYVRSEGAGMVVVERVGRSMASGARIYATLRGTAVNQDGRSNGLMAPNPDAQVDVIRRAWEAAGLGPEAAEYVEAHGTGTQLGDPIEARALARALGAGRSGPCAVGSVKTNLGHLEAAAGIAGLIKVALSLHHGTLPPSLHFERPNPHVDLATLGLRPCTDLRPWPRGGLTKRRAGVSSYGFGGTNAHVVVEEAPASATSEEARRERPGIWCLPISAESAPALSLRARRFAASLEGRLGNEDLVDLCHSAAVRRGHGAYRVAVAGRTVADLAARLRQITAGPTSPDRPLRDGGVVFVVPGQGGEWTGMGRELLDTEPAFSRAVSSLDRLVQARSGWSVVEALRGQGDEAHLGRISVVQPCLFAFYVGLAALWRDRGLEPAAVVGHSTGEVAAAAIAGALTDEEAIDVVLRRSSLLERVSGRGAMAVVGLDEADAAAAMRGLETEVSIAALNGPSNTVLTGSPEAVDAILAQLTARDVYHRRLPISVASHSPQVEPLLRELRESLAELRPRRTQVPFFSSVLPGPLQGLELGAAYWAENLRRPVRFAAAIGALVAEGRRAFLELGPHPVLVRSIEATLHAADRPGLVLPGLSRDTPAADSLAHALGELYRNHLWCDWGRLYPRGRLISLPPPAWDRRRVWFEPARQAPTRDGGRRTRTYDLRSLARLPGCRSWDFELSHPQFEHREEAEESVKDPELGLLSCELPLDAVLSVVADLTGQKCELAQVEILTQLVWPESGTVGFQAYFEGEGDPGRFELFVQPGADEPWSPFARGAICIIGGESLEETGARADGLPFLVATEPQEGILALALAALRTAPGVAGQASGLPHGTPCFFARYRRNPLRAAARVSIAADSSGAAWRLRVSDAEGNVMLDADGVRFAAPAADRERAAALARATRATYEIAWRPAPASQPGRLQGRWILLGGGETSKALACSLEMAGASAQVIPSPTASMTELHRLLGGRDTPRGIVDLTGLDILLSGDDPDELPRAARATISGALAVLGAVQGSGGSATPRIWWALPRAAGAEQHGDLAGLAHSVLHGFGMVASLEQPHSFGAIIEVSGRTPEESARAIAAALAAPPGETRLSASADGCLVPRLVRQRRSATAPPPFACRVDGAYLLTGGTGGLGVEVARWLVERGARRLILTSRHGGDEQSVREIARLEAAGTQVRVVRADVSDGTELRACFAAFEGVPVRGIVHAAGASLERPLGSTGFDTVDEMFRPKVDGAWQLHLLARELAPELDFFVLFGSAASVWGSLRLGAYAAANAFLGSLASHRRSLGLPALCVDWGWWAEGRLVTDDAQRYFESIGVKALDSATALAALERLLTSRVTRALVADVDWGRFRSVYELGGARPLLASLEAGPEPRQQGGVATPEATLRRALESLPPSERLPAVLSSAREEAAAVLKLPAADVDVTVGLFQMGMDSVMMLELKRRLERAFGLKLAPTLLFEHPNLERLGEHLLGLLGLGPAAGSVPPQEEAARLSDQEVVDRLARKLAQLKK